MVSFWIIFVGFVNIFSLISAFALIYFVHISPEASRRRLVTRQLVSLSIAGIGANLLSLPLTVIDFSNVFRGDARICNTFLSAYEMPRMVTLLQETHIAVTLLSQLSHWRWAIPVLSWGIPVVWGLGTLLGLLLALLAPPASYDDKVGCMLSLRDHITGSAYMFCIFLSLCACLVAVIKICRSRAPYRVRARFLTKATCFPLVSVISYAMLFMVYMEHDLYFSPPWFFHMALVMELSNPALNTISYFLGISFASSATRRSRTEAHRTSFNVDFSGAEIIDIEVLSESLSLNWDNLTGCNSQNCQGGRHFECGEVQ